MVKITLTDRQYHTLIELLEREFDAELKYQDESIEPDTSLLEDYVDVYNVLENAPVTNIISAVVANEMCLMRQQQIDELKERKHD